MAIKATNQAVYRISIADKVAVIVGSRDIVNSLVDIIKMADSSSVELDFKNVEFLSRSAAHEFLLLKEKFAQQHNIVLSFTNTPDNIAQMLRIVAANRALPKTKEVSLKFDGISFNNFSDHN